MRAPQLGFTYLGLLIAIAIASVTLAATAIVWHTASQREKEKDLLFVGGEFQRAIGAYYEGSPGRAKQYPRALEDLLRDPRLPQVRRYLRRLYADPVTQGTQWGIVKSADGGIAGVYSLSRRAPIRKADFPAGNEHFALAKDYAGWTFRHAPPQAVPAAAAGASQPGQHPLAAAAITRHAADGGTQAAQSPAAGEGSHRPEACTSLLRADTSACRDTLRTHGAQQGDACQASAQARHQQCVAAGTLGPLLTQPGRRR